MNQTTSSFKHVLALGTVVAVLSSVPFATANTPRGTAGFNTGSEIAPINLSPRIPVPKSPNIRRDPSGRLILLPRGLEDLNKGATLLIQDLRGGSVQIPKGTISREKQTAIADLLQSSSTVYRNYEVIGELRTVITEYAIPPGEEGVAPERPGFVGLDLKRLNSTPNSISARFVRYASHLGARRGEYRVFGSDRRGINRDITVVLIPKLNRQIEIRFAAKSGNDAAEPRTQTILAPNTRVASVLVGVLTALETAGVSPTTQTIATDIILSLGNLSFSELEAIQLAQSLTEVLTSSEGLLAGCGGQSGAAVTCTEFNVNHLSTAVRAYNEIVKRSSNEVLVALSNNPEFQALGLSLRRLRDAITLTASQ